MVAPISTDKPLSADESRTSAGNRATEQASRADASGNQNSTSAPPAVNPDADTATVDRAAQLYRQSSLTSATEGSVTTPEQARELVSRISQQMAEQAGQAFQSQAGGVSADLTAVLETTPA